MQQSGSVCVISATLVMSFSKLRHLLSIVVLCAGIGRLAAQGEPFALFSPAGAGMQFSEGSSGWRWTQLVTPKSPESGWVIAEEAIEVETPERTVTLHRGWTLADSRPDRVVLEQDATDTGVRVRRVFSFGPAANVLRIETWVQSPEGRRQVLRIGLLNMRIEGESFRETGAAPMSFPVFGQKLFAGIEHVSGEAGVEGELADRVRLQHRPRMEVGEPWQLVAAVVVGWPQPGIGNGLTGEAGMREAFLHYLDSVRIKPERMVLHTDTWWTVPLPLNEKNVLYDIETLRKGFFDRTGMFFDTYCVDLGWSNPQTLWRMETERFPNELRPINDRLAALGGKMGLWMSPGSGYPDGLSNPWLQSQGYEMTPFGSGLDVVPCFALGGRYQREFKERAVTYAQQYGLGHVILDFMAQRCDVASHGHPVGPESRYAIDAGLADVLDGLRAVNPQMALEPMVCGYPPSPWWLMKTPFVLGPAGDDLPYGRGPAPNWLESLITARDVAYRAGQEAWIMPTQALETFDIIVLTPGEFQNTAVMAIGRGRWFLSTYFKADQMKPEDWDFFAALVRWARENKEHLVNAWQFGGKPENREAYGFMFRNPGRDLYCVRNPWIEERTIELPASMTATEPRDVRMIYPRRANVGRIEPGGRGPRLVLGPYETVFLETAPASEIEPDFAVAPPPRIIVAAEAPSQLVPASTLQGEETVRVRYHWEGTVSVPPGLIDPELCILVEGSAEVAQTVGEVFLKGRPAEVQATTSVGQFGAAIDVSPENWTWLMVPLPPGDTTFEIDVTVRAPAATFSVFVRGSVAVGNAPAPEGVAVFPTHRADRKAWSQTLQSPKSFSVLER